MKIHIMKTEMFPNHSKLVSQSVIGKYREFPRIICCIVFFTVFIWNNFSALGQTICEAENATLSGPVIGSQNPGYSGTGYADYQNATGDYIEFTLSANSAGTYPIAFRYANGSTGDRALQLSVNGVVAISSLSFPVTGGWATWGFTATNNVTFNTGTNTVRITSIGSNGANVDYLLVTVSGTQPYSVSPVTDISWTNVQQHIDGFGFSSAWCGTLSSAKNNALYNTLGMSLLRVRIDENGAWSQEISNASAAHAAGVKVFGSPWSAPVVWTSNGSNSGGYLLPSHYADYANWLSNAAVSMDLDYVSIQNEPDYSAWMNWTSAQILDFMKTNAPSIGRPIVMPESFHFNDAYSDPVINDATAVSNFSILGGHLYGGGNYVHTNALAHDKHVWMTEHYIDGSATNITDCMVAAKEISDCMNNQMSAYVWWWVYNSATGILLADSSGNIYEIGYAIGQFAKFIRPGYYRIGTMSVGAGAAVTAYKDLVSGNFAIVAINTSSTVITQQFNLDGFTAPSVTPWITSSNLSLAAQSPITITGSSFTCLIQPLSIVTFVGTVGGAVPMVPTGLTATGASSGINLSWTASSGATTYNVKRAGVSGGPYTVIATGISGTSYFDTGLPAGTPYYYVVTAVNANGESGRSNEAGATTPLVYEAENAFLSGPVVSTQNPGYSGTGYADYVNASVDYVEWTVNVASAGTYSLVFRYSNGGTTDRPLQLAVNGAVVNSGLSFPPTGSWSTWATVSNNAALNAGNNTVRTTAIGSSGGDLDYLQVTGSGVGAAPSAPTSLSTTGGNLVVNLGWTQSTSPGITGNNIYRSSTGSGGTYNLLARLAATTSYSDTAVSAGSTYFYSVTATNANGESALSTYAGATTVPSAPGGLTTTAGNAQVALIWTASSGAANYNVKRATVSGGPYTTLASPTTASYTDTTAVNGTTYYYVVSALNGSGESANSSQVSATPTAPTAPAAPTGLTAVAQQTKGKIKLTWTQSTSSNISSNSVYRATVNGGPYTKVTTIAANTAYTDTGRTSGATYYYVVTAINSSSLESAYSNQASATSK